MSSSSSLEAISETSLVILRSFSLSCNDVLFAICHLRRNGRLFSRNMTSLRNPTRLSLPLPPKKPFASMASHHRATATASTSTWGASPSYPAASTRDILVGYIGEFLLPFSSQLAPTKTHRSSSTPPSLLARISCKCIERACDPSLHEPNLSLDLEIADLINSKKANTYVSSPESTFSLSATCRADS